MNDYILVRRSELADWRNDLSMHGVGDIHTASEIDRLLGKPSTELTWVTDMDYRPEEIGEPETNTTGPTQEAYDAACSALWKHRDEASSLRSALKEIAERNTTDGYSRDIAMRALSKGANTGQPWPAGCHCSNAPGACENCGTDEQPERGE